MAKNARHRISTAALELFSQQYYDLVSVAQICRTAGVSNGAFYRHFRDKEEIFQYLLDDFLSRFAADLRAIDGNDAATRLMRFVEVVSGAAYRYAGQVTMFREGQYRHPEYEQRLREIYMRSAETVLARPVDEAEYLFLLSGLRFLSTRSRYHDLRIGPGVLDRLVQLLENGVFGEDATISLVGEPPPVPPDEYEPQDSGEALVAAGIRCIGRDGYFAVQVADITREAGLSVGTFYKRFESKEAFLGEVVRQIGRRTRRYLSSQAPATGNHLDREIAGMWNFLGYFRRHREYYTIVREAEFVVPIAVKEYYDAFERGYVHGRGLAMYPEEDRPVVANFLMGLSHYLGIEVLFSTRVTDVRGLVARLGGLLGHGIRSDA